MFFVVDGNLRTDFRQTDTQAKPDGRGDGNGELNKGLQSNDKIARRSRGALNKEKDRRPGDGQRVVPWKGRGMRRWRK